MPIVKPWYKNAHRRERQRGWSKRENCHWKSFHSINYIIDHQRIGFFFYKQFKLFRVTFSVLIAAPFKFRSLCSSHKLIAIQILIWIYEFFENFPQKRVFCNENLSNLKNVLHRNWKTNRAKEYIFSVFESIWKFLCSASILMPTKVAPYWVEFVYHSAQKNSGYITVKLQFVIVINV